MIFEEMIFEAFPKVPRLFRDITITEKLDGTNAQVLILTIDEALRQSKDYEQLVAAPGEYRVFAGSRKRYITPDDDNFGFARWVREHAEELICLGHGRHFGEWWGQGIQRGYGLDEKRFSLFNTKRWNDETVPKCCHVVPVLYEGPLQWDKIDLAAENLRNYGSKAAPGFANPEGIMIYHHAANQVFKYTPANGDGHKG